MGDFNFDELPGSLLFWLNSPTGEQKPGQHAGLPEKELARLQYVHREDIRRVHPRFYSFFYDLGGDRKRDAVLTQEIWDARCRLAATENPAETATVTQLPARPKSGGERADGPRRETASATVEYLRPLRRQGPIH